MILMHLIVTKVNLKKITIFFIASICSLVAIASSQSNNDNMGKDTSKSTNATLVYPLFIDEPFQVPDTLQYSYSSNEAKGTALSGGVFSVFLNYPIFRSDDAKVKKIIPWLDEQIFVLADEGLSDTDSLPALFKSDYAAYANHTLNSWLSIEEITLMGCMQESISVEVVLNSIILTMRMRHKGYWGGARGDDNQTYTMFDKDFNVIEPMAVIDSTKQIKFKQLLIKEYNKQIHPWENYGNEYKSTPDYFALTRAGLIVQYSGYSFVEGNPQMHVKKDKIIDYLKPEYQVIYKSIK